MVIQEQQISSMIEQLLRRAYHDEEALRFIADYFEFLAERIHARYGALSANPTLISRFEAVYLWLMDRLLVYPDAVRDQVRALVGEKDLCGRFAVLANVVEEAQEQRGAADDEIPPVQVVDRFTRPFIELLFDTVRMKMPDDSVYPSKKELYEIKITLRRLAQILRYAASLDALEYEEPFTDFRDNYDPNLVDKNKLGVLINILRIQVEEVPNDQQRQKLLQAIDRLDAEMRRKKIRWGVVIAGFFVLFGFLADLKSLAPNVYDAPLRTVETIISMLHEDAQVQRGRPFLPNTPSEHSSPEPGGHSTDHPMRSLPPQLRSEDEEADK
ncbi:hypothetical protein [Longimicrobium sp.]|jgi:hypothetical protein|uniref:hypothetical protein n=1 Tax=Longimicrobium sp. TaxID=2029185 RepID=UPI002F92AAD5